MTSEGVAPLASPRGVVGESSDDPFDAGPCVWAPRALGIPGRHRKGGRLALVTAAIAWVPLAILAAFEGLALSTTVRDGMLLDWAAYGRYLIAGPLFVCAAFVYLPELARVVRHFLRAGLIAESDQRRYQALIDSTRRLLQSRWTEGLLIGLAYALTIMTSSLLYPAVTPTWPAPVPGRLSLAGWWRTLVSQPLFYALFGAWLWRLLLWTRFLWTVSRFDLRLVAGHPDLVGGLRFVMVPVRGFAILAFAMGSIAAGSVGDAVLAGGRSPWEFRYFIAAQILLVLALFAGPPLLLMGAIFRLQARGTFEYGRLATQLGHEFERRWLRNDHIHADTLGVSDFSATVDLFTTVATVRSIKLLVLDLRPLVTLVVATLLPYVPLVFALMPLDRIVDLALKALL